jgi:hypothetical protein
MTIVLTKDTCERAARRGIGADELVADVADLLERGLVMNGDRHFLRVYATDLSRCYLVKRSPTRTLVVHVRWK